MAGYSVESLLAWMKVPGNNVMWGWDVIAALSRNKTNTLLLQEYIARFTTGSYLPPISGEVEMVSGQFKEYIHEFILDSPRLSFEDAHLDNFRATLTCSIVGGVQFSMKNDVDTWQTVKVSEIDPLQGPRLTLQLFLPDVPGNVNDDGRVMLDLSNSDDFMLNFALTEHEQRLGGDFFKDLFNQLPDEKRIWVLGSIQQGPDELRRPQSFKLRPQANGQASRDPRTVSYGDGAILVLICLFGGKPGGMPADDYPFLIPDDAQEEYSATVLFDRERESLALLVDSAAAIISSNDFIYSYNESGQLYSATAQSGQLVISAWEYQLPPINEVSIKAEMGELVLPVDGDNIFLAKYEGGKPSIIWETKGTLSVTLSSAGMSPHTVQITYYLVFSAAYDLVYSESGNGSVILQRTDFILEKTYTETEVLSTDPNWAVIAPLAFVVLFTFLHETLVLSRFELAFRLQFEVGTVVDNFLKKNIELNFGQAIVGDTLRAPRDIAFFGRINPIRTSFLISPMERLMAAGATRDFTTDPVVDGVEWTVGAVEEEGLLRGARSAGSISPRGVYTAPAADSIDGRFTRVRVTATDKTSGYYSSALVTVLVNDLTINPLIQSCGYGQSVELAAGALGDELGEEELIWAIKNPVPGESGSLQPSELPEGDHVYVAGNQVPNKTYVLDEIEVTSKAGKTRSAWILVVQKEPMVKVKPVLEAGLPVGQIKLRAWVNNVLQDPEWMLAPGSPGEIHSDGLYISDPAASHRFVLVLCTVDAGLWGIAEGHIILPLPLDSFPAEVELMMA